MLLLTRICMAIAAKIIQIRALHHHQGSSLVEISCNTSLACTRARVNSNGSSPICLLFKIAKCIWKSLQNPSCMSRAVHVKHVSQPFFASNLLFLLNFHKKSGDSITVLSYWNIPFALSLKTNQVALPTCDQNLAWKICLISKDMKRVSLQL